MKKDFYMIVLLVQVQSIIFVLVLWSSSFQTTISELACGALAAQYRVEQKRLPTLRLCFLSTVTDRRRDCWAAQDETLRNRREGYQLPLYCSHCYSVFCTHHGVYLATPTFIAHVAVSDRRLQNVEKPLPELHETFSTKIPSVLSSKHWSVSNFVKLHFL